MADKTNLDGQKHKAVLDKLVDVGPSQRKNMIDETATKKWTHVHVHVCFISPMLLLFFVMIDRHRLRQGRNLTYQGFGNKGELRPFHRFPCRSIYIIKINFSNWKPPGVSERMWSVNLDASISGEYQTLGGYSSRLSE